VSLREPLSPDELVKALLTGKPPRDRRAPLFRRALEIIVAAAASRTRFDD
jgi:hypothetical protein